VIQGGFIPRNFETSNEYPSKRVGIGVLFCLTIFLTQRDTEFHTEYHGEVIAIEKIVECYSPSVFLCVELRAPLCLKKVSSHKSRYSALVF